MSDNHLEAIIAPQLPFSALHLARATWEEAIALFQLHSATILAAPHWEKESLP